MSSATSSLNGFSFWKNVFGGTLCFGLSPSSQGAASTAVRHATSSASRSSSSERFDLVEVDVGVTVSLLLVTLDPGAAALGGEGLSRDRLAERRVFVPLLV